MRRVKDNSDNEVDEMVFLIMSDYDPTGYDIANTVREQASRMAETLNMNCRITLKRIGIVPDQLKDEVKNNQYTPKKKGMERWMKLTGGIDGKEKGLELDALTPDRIRQIFTDNLREYIDSTEYYEHGKQIYLIRKIHDELDIYVDSIVNEVYNKLKDAVDTKEYNVLDYLEKGYNYIPYGEVCSVDSQVVKDCVKKYFE